MQNDRIVRSDVLTWRHRFHFRQAESPPSFPPHEREGTTAEQDKKAIRQKYEMTLSFKFTDTSH